MEEKVYKEFDTLGIEYSVIHHKAFFTVNDSSNSGIEFKGCDCKNLFLTDEKTDRYLLVSLPVLKRLNTKLIEKEFNIKKVKFASEEKLIQKLGVKSGTCSLLNIIEKPDTDVFFVIDSQVLNSEFVSFHPNDNMATISFKSDDITKLMDNYTKNYKFLEL